MSDLTPELEKRYLRGGLRFQGACPGLGSTAQALGFDMIRLKPCPTIRRDTVVTLSD